MRLDENACWQAICERQRQPSPFFLFAVKTTGIYCLPHCPARRPGRDRVQFFPSCEAAVRAGYRACLRCRPDQPERGEAAVREACQYLISCPELPTLAQLAERAGLSPHHFHRLFRSHTGVTPARYARSLRQERLRQLLGTCCSITEASYEAGYGSSGGFYQQASEALGMTPGQYRRGGRGLVLRFAIGRWSLGTFLIAASPRGICSVLLGHTDQEVVEQFEQRFPAASRQPDPGLVEALLPLLESLEPAELPLDLQGTVFQKRVWEALRQLHRGQTISYAELATQLERPGSARAVAQACAKNPVAVLIPCHRVVGSDGALKGYRWGLQRKAELLRRECEGSLTAQHAPDLP